MTCTCGKDADHIWFSHNKITSSVQQNRLNTGDVECVFVLGCTTCGEDIRRLSPADIIGMLSRGSEDNRPCNTDMFLAALLEHGPGCDRMNPAENAIEAWVHGGWNEALSYLPGKVRADLMKKPNLEEAPAVELNDWEQRKLSSHASSSYLTYAEYDARGGLAEKEKQEMAHWKRLAEKLKRPSEKVST